jgi:hypothetical protein
MPPSITAYLDQRFEAVLDAVAAADAIVCPSHTSPNAPRVRRGLRRNCACSATA